VPLCNEEYDGTPLDMASLDCLLSKSRKECFWDLLLLVLHHSPELARKKHGLPTNNPFLLIHAAVEMCRDNLSTVSLEVDQVTWGQTGKVGIMGEGLECRKKELYDSIYLDINYYETMRISKRTKRTWQTWLLRALHEIARKHSWL